MWVKTCRRLSDLSNMDFIQFTHTGIAQAMPMKYAFIMQIAGCVEIQSKRCVFVRLDQKLEAEQSSLELC